MKFILSNINVTEADRTNDGQFDVINLLKREYKIWVKRLIRDNKEKDMIQSGSKDTVRVHHGTTTSHLFDILTYGLRPSSITKKSNWDITHNGENLSSMDNVVYVTTKWHYYYANVLAKAKREIPCYITFDIPKSFLIPDEDAFHSKLSHDRFYKHYFSKGSVPFYITGEESLNYYHTAGVPFGVPISYIKEITILGDKQFLSTILSPSSSYQKDVEEWSSGLLNRDVKLSSVLKRQNRSLYNKTFKINHNNEEYFLSSKIKIQDFIESLSNQIHK